MFYFQISRPIFFNRLRVINSFVTHRKQRTFIDSPLEKNNGYSRVCGDCTEFCEFMPGEEKSYHVNHFITTCFDAKKEGKKEN